MFGRPGQNAAQQAAQRAAAQRRDMMGGYWYERQREKHQLVQYCLCGARKVRRMVDGHSSMEYICPNRHRPDHQPGAAYGRPVLLYRTDTH